MESRKSVAAAYLHAVAIAARYDNVTPRSEKHRCVAIARASPSALPARFVASLQ